MSVDLNQELDLTLTTEGEFSLINIFNRSLEESKQINSTKNAENVIHSLSTVYGYNFSTKEKVTIILWLLNHGQNSTKEIVRKDILANCKDKVFLDKLKRISIPR